jgi:hypothetical protein
MPDRSEAVRMRDVRENISTALGFNVEGNGDRDMERRDDVRRFLDDGIRRSGRREERSEKWKVEILALILGPAIGLIIGWVATVFHVKIGFGP